MSERHRLPPAPHERSRRSRQEILEAGYALLEEGGPQALTTAAVAARAEISRRIIGRHNAGGHRCLSFAAAIDCATT
ncbi:TetR family transcriptional regulator [Nonomuraea sp. NPDC049480]|uniref:TetR family transcriptional regulator n=1 Tax=Nonomuraea sp. NPDC049480 TaxID=3364353 RepID=UPI0037B0C3CB